MFLAPALLMVGVVSGQVGPPAHPTFSLDYQRRSDTGCPDRPHLQEAVAHRLGRNPWDDGAMQRFQVVIRRQTGGRLVANVDLVDAEGRRLGARVLRSADPECEELAAAVALAITIAIDPLAVVAPSMPTPEPPPDAPLPSEPPSSNPVPHLPEEEPTPWQPWHGEQALAATPPPRSPTHAPPPTETSTVIPPPIADPAPRLVPRRHRRPAEDAGWHYFLTLHQVVDGWSAPHPTLGGVLGVGLRWRDASLAVESRVDVPAFRRVGPGRISTQLVTLSAVPCWHVGWLMGCGLVTGGGMRVGAMDLQQSTRATVPYLAAGARLGVELPVLHHLRVRTGVEALGVPLRVRLRDSLSGETFWDAPPATAALSLGLLGLFP